MCKHTGGRPRRTELSSHRPTPKPATYCPHPSPSPVPCPLDTITHRTMRAALAAAALLGLLAVANAAGPWQVCGTKGSKDFAIKRNKWVGAMDARMPM